jgi:hypothetical protein
MNKLQKLPSFGLYRNTAVIGHAIPTLKVKSQRRHIVKTISSTIDIHAKSEIIWENITNVKIEQYSDPFIFKILGVPKPLKADVVSTGEGGQRIAYFSSGKRFIQKITTWKPLHEYSFDFNPEPGFIVGHFFDLSDGIFRVPNGTYLLTGNNGTTTLQLCTTYSLDKGIYLLFNLPVRIILKAFQRYLLRSIKKNSE